MRLIDKASFKEQIAIKKAELKEAIDKINQDNKILQDELKKLGRLQGEEIEEIEKRVKAIEDTLKEAVTLTECTDDYILIDETYWSFGDLTLTTFVRFYPSQDTTSRQGLCLVVCNEEPWFPHSQADTPEGKEEFWNSDKGIHFVSRLNTIENSALNVIDKYYKKAIFEKKSKQGEMRIKIRELKEAKENVEIPLFEFLMH